MKEKAQIPWRNSPPSKVNLSSKSRGRIEARSRMPSQKSIRTGRQCPIAVICERVKNDREKILQNVQHRRETTSIIIYPRAINYTLLYRRFSFHWQNDAYSSAFCFFPSLTNGERTPEIGREIGKIQFVVCTKERITIDVRSRDENQTIKASIFKPHAISLEGTVSEVYTVQKL